MVAVMGACWEAAVAAQSVEAAAAKTVVAGQQAVVASSHPAAQAPVAVTPEQAGPAVWAAAAASAREGR